MDLGCVYFYEIKTRFGIMRRYRLCATYYRRLFPVLFVPCHGLLLHFIFRLLSALFFTAWMRWCWIIYKTKRYDFSPFGRAARPGSFRPMSLLWSFFRPISFTRTHDPSQHICAINKKINNIDCCLIGHLSISRIAFPLYSASLSTT